MNKISPLFRRCMFLLLLAVMVASASTGQSLEPRIVFASNHDGNWDGNWDIYSMDVNGKNLRQLTDHPARDDAPSCSPDGRRIAFRSERDLTTDLYVMNSDGKILIRLTHDNFGEDRASWSPDGTRMIFSSFRFNVGNVEIYAMDADGNNRARLAKHNWHDVRPSWSPDGRKIAFASYRNGGFNDPFNIFVMNADGEGRRNLTGDTVLANARSSNPAWSPDGRKIAFQCQRLFEGYDIYVITAEGENLEKLTEDGGSRFPAYSPDGERIAFASHRGGDFDIYLMDTNGRNVVKITNTPPGTDNIFPSWMSASGPFAVNRNGKLPTSWGVLKETGNP